jgi:hypothetical protein
MTVKPFRLLAVLATALLLTACASGPKKVAYGSFEATLPEKTGAIKRIAITNFFVQYVTDIGVESEKNNNTFYSKTQGLTQETLQTTANSLYDELVVALNDAGIEVVGKDALNAIPEYKEIQNVSTKSPYAVNDSSIRKMSTMVSAYNMPIYVSTVSDVKLPVTYNIARKESDRKIIRQEQNESEWLRDMSSSETFNLSTIYGGQMKISKALGAATMSVRLTVPMFDMGIESPKTFFGGGGDKGFVKANARFVEGGTIFHISNAEPGSGEVGKFTLTKPVPISGLKVDISNGNGPRDGGGLVGALLGATGVNSDKADFYVNIEASTFKPSLVASSKTLFKDVAQGIKNPPK